MSPMDEAKSGAASLEQQLRKLLSELCVDWRFCIPPEDADRISRTKCWKAKEFATEVLRAEGMWPKYEAKWSRRIERRFVDRFGDTVSVEDFQTH